MKKTMEIIGPIVALVSGVLALINQFYNVFWSFDGAPELLLVICCLGLIAYGIRLLTAKPAAKRRQSKSRRAFYAGLALVLVTPIAGVVFWASTMRLSTKDRAAFDDHLLKAKAYEEIEYTDDAIREYEAARRIAPWKGSIKARLRELKSSSP